MKRFSYSEPDYAFGQIMLTLRTTIGLTQAGLGDLLGVSRRAVARWEAGSSYPTVERLKQLITLGVQQQAFPAGRQEEEIRALWHAAHQKVLLDEAWLAALLGRPRPALTLLPPVPLAEPQRGEVSAAEPKPAPRVDWGEALDVPTFYDREQELARLSRWVGEEGCRMVSVLGMGGMGKSALVVRAMQQLAGHFAVVLFRSLRDAPECSALLDDWLLVLDNLEVLLEEGNVLGRLRPGFEAYGHLLRQVAQTAHQSCLLLTSREKPAGLRALEGSRTRVRSLRLSGLQATACEQLLAEHEVSGSQEERTRLQEIYAGNPLALNIVAETIADLFGGAIEPFLSGGTTIFGSITQLLDEQWGRLSPLEQTVLYWLAILREPVTLDDLLAVLVARLAHVQVLEAVDGLRRRSLIERGQRAGSFTLQSVVLEYVTTKLVTTASQEIGQGRLLRLREHGLSQAQAKEYVRQTQQRLLLAPLLARLESMYQGRAEVEGQLRALLDGLRERAQEAQGYGPANLVALLRLLRGNLRGLDLSHLALRRASLQGVELQDANLSGALLRECVLTETFDATLAVAISRSGQYWAAASQRGEVRVWEWEQEAGQTLHLVWQAHTDTTYALAFSPDERRLASGSLDNSVKLWDVASGTLLWSGWHTKGTTCLAFAPDGSRLATGGNDATVRLWDLQSGTQLQTLPHPSPILSVAASPDRH